MINNEPQEIAPVVIFLYNDIFQKEQWVRGTAESGRTEGFT